MTNLNEGLAFPHRSGNPHTVQSLKTLIQRDGVKQFLLNHGCTIDEEGTQGPECTVIFPAGTTRTELYPRAMEARFRILLPDHVELREIDNRRERSQLYIVLDDLPDRIIEELRG